ncbi:cytochrome c [Winogradskyella sp. DF17]|uniref:Cytochrome c n=1 Tax=Winogradskyella pelagia TaxID=2819984 RepID=A0ABS3T434_9FLAO|nr:cytochrome c [Winogradskyella sp. DF17]MBO3116636.1 cytochrome c [Winogradskyella sp. DF17]
MLLINLLLSCKSDTKKSDPYAQKSIVNKTSFNNGKLIYNTLCITCHMADGKGVEKVFPPLANSDYLRENQEGSIRAIKYGMSGEIVVNGITYNSLMAPLGLSDEEVVDVMTYINNAWGNKIDNKVTAEIVANTKK